MTAIPFTVASATSRLFFGALIAAALTSGCVMDQTSPLIHIKPPNVRHEATKVERLITELRGSDLVTERYTPAEQIAAYAVHELANGNEWDAALLLSLASYRYHQQANLAKQALFTPRLAINPAMMEQYGEYVWNEFKVFHEQSYEQELDLVRGHLFGFAVASERRDQYVEAFARTGEEDDTFFQRLQDFQVEMSNQPERLAHPELAEAFLARLVEDLRDDMLDGLVAFQYLATTPLDEFRLAALDHTKYAFSAPLMRNTVPRMRTLREQIKARLDHSRPYTRATAAALLGLDPDPADIERLESRLSREPNALVQDSIRFALIRNDELEHLSVLVEHASPPGRLTTGSARSASIEQSIPRPHPVSSDERAHALHLVQWLPLEIKLTLDEGLLVDAARGTSNAPFLARLMALFTLRDMASKKTLSPVTVRVILARTSDEDEHIASAASQVVAALEQLGVEECKALARMHPQARVALLTRMQGLVSLGDLEYLRETYESSDDVELQMAAAMTVAGVPGTASLALLKRWLVESAEHDDLRPFMTLVALLASRPDVGGAGLEHLELAPAKRLMIEIALNSDAVSKTAASLGRSTAPRPPSRTHSPRELNSSASFGRSTSSAGLNAVAIHDAMQITFLAVYIERPALQSALWKFARYRKDDYYPYDAVVRRNAMAALLRLALRRRTERQVRTASGRARTSAPNPSHTEPPPGSPRGDGTSARRQAGSRRTVAPRRP